MARWRPLADGFVEKVEDVISMGDEVACVIINVDDRGKVKLSVKQAQEAGETVDA